MRQPTSYDFGDPTDKQVTVRMMPSIECIRLVTKSPNAFRSGPSAIAMMSYGPVTASTVCIPDMEFRASDTPRDLDTAVSMRIYALVGIIYLPDVNFP